MAASVPSRKPQMTKGELEARIKSEHPNFIVPDFLVVGIRGYYKKTMGNPSLNDRGIYDDAIFLMTKNSFKSFNANCDPAAFQKGIANLKNGIYPAYKFDLHKGKYLAICQRSANVTVLRDGKGEDTGMFGINIHCGGVNTTSSLGCQTIPPAQWDEFIKDAQVLARDAYGTDFKKHTITYLLLENL